MDDITPRDLAKGRNLRAASIAAPLLLTGLPAMATLAALLLASATPPVAAVMLFIGAAATLVGFIVGIVLLVIFTQRRSAWSRELRDRMVARGIRAEEVQWFRRELRPNEKRALKAVEARDPLLADAYRETLASRLTAARIVRSSMTELSLAKKRKSSLKRLKSSRSEEFGVELDKDIANIGRINGEARTMLEEAESRLQMIEAAASRTGTLADSELALKKLSARTAQLPIALEAAKMSEQIRKELDSEMENEEGRP